MTSHSMSLMDVLAPPGNPWLADIARRKTDLPAGVRIVRFSEAEDDIDLESDVALKDTAKRKNATK